MNIDLRDLAGLLACPATSLALDLATFTGDGDLVGLVGLRSYNSVLSDGQQKD